MDLPKISSFPTNDDIIVSLLSVPFSTRNDSEKDNIMKLGRPMPELNLLKRYKDHGRTFQLSWYHQHKWLCGSEEKAKLFCWPCLLTCSKKGAWTTDGFDDLKNVSRAIFRHASSREHLNSYISLNKMSKRVVKSSQLFLERTRIENIKYNELIKKNREVLKVFIDITSVLSKQGLLCERSDSSLEGSFDSNSLKAIFDLVMKRNTEVKQHWEKTEGFRNFTANLQNELIECFHDELQKAIESEMKRAAFYACMVEGTGNVSGNKEVSIVVRLVDSNGKVQEYFLGFHKVEGHRTAQHLIGVLCKVLGKFNMKQKLVALTYDGRCVASSELNYFQTKIKEFVPQAIFPHNFAQSINLILQHSCSTIKPAKEFFSKLQGIPSFFHGYTTRTEILKRVLGCDFPTCNEVLWNANFKVISAVHTNRLALIEVFKQLIELSSDAATVRQSQCNINSLKDFKFVFLLALFHDVFEKTDALFTAYKNISNGTKLWISGVANCISYVRQQRTDKACEEFISATENRTGTKLSDFYTSDSYYKQIYFEVLDNIITQLEFKSSNCKNLSFLRLGNVKKFSHYDTEFPDDAFTSVLAAYGSHFNQEKLKTELETIFSSDHKDDFHGLNLKQLIERIVVDDMTDILPEAFKLFCLIATIPASSSSSLCMSRIKSYIRNSTTRDHYALVYIEKDTLARLEQWPSWYDDVITRFAQKERPVDLLYRPVTCNQDFMVSLSNTTL